jgi:hypothetical protein
MAPGYKLFTGIIALTTLAALPSAPLAAATKLKEETFFTKLPVDTVAMTAGKYMSMRVPTGIQPLNEPGIESGLIDMQKMRNQAGEVVGFAAQLQVWASDENGKTKDEYKTTWTVVLPGRGTLFLSETENPSALFRQLSELRAKLKTWKGRIGIQTTTGPAAGGVGLIVGGTGEFEGQKGTFIETDEFTSFDAGETGEKAAKGVEAAGGVAGSTTLFLYYAN